MLLPFLILAVEVLILGGMVLVGAGWLLAAVLAWAFDRLRPR
jgi:hypothetical protein